MRIPAPRFPVESVVSTAPTRRPARPLRSRPRAAGRAAGRAAMPPAARPTLFEAGTVRASEDGSRWRVTNDAHTAEAGNCVRAGSSWSPAPAPRERAPPPPARGCC